MRDTSFTTSEGTVVQQRMVSNDSKPKGLKLVLEERNLWLKGLRQKCNLNPPAVPTPTCCACHRLGAQPDFQNQKSILYEALEGTGHLCDFLPKFHCELAPIETIGDSQNSGLVPVVTTLSRRGEKLCHYLLTLFLCPPSESTSVVPII